MKTLFTFLCIAISSIIFGQEAASPYLEIIGKQTNIPLKSTKANVEIAGNIAHVQIIQTYQNLGKKPIEANYVFPMSTQAAVHNMEMTVGNRTTKAIVYEKQKAKKVYQNAIKAGKRASKLAQKRPNVFQMKVGNIMPNEEIAISIYYTEMVMAIAGEYQYVFPGVVGPRFTGENTSKETTFNLPYTQKGIADSFDYSINVCINGGMMIQNIASTSHEIKVHYPDTSSAELSISANEENPANRDFILNYSLRGNKIQSGLLLYEGEKENFFSFMIEPPKNNNPKIVPPREYLFVIDVSGSMGGYPLEVSKSLMRNLLGGLKETDTFNVQLFASTSSIYKNKSVAATQKNINQAIQYLNSDHAYGGGGTRLIHALKTAYDLPRKDKNAARTMVVITDGYISVEKEAFQLIENNLDKANVFTFGIGSSVNRYLIEGMAKISNSQSFIATNKEDALKVAKSFKNLIASPLLTQIKLTTQGFDIYDVEPKTIPDVFADRPILIYGKYRGKAKGNIAISGWQANGKITQKQEVIQGRLSKNNKALKYLWARKKIERLVDYKKNFGDDIKQEVIDLGLQYNLATQYTSFVAVDNEIVNKKGKVLPVKQVVPMPKNVNNTAVGAEASIQGKSVYKKSFQVRINSILENSKKRTIKMWLKGSFSKVIKMYLKKYSRLKIHIDKNGKIVKIEKEEKGVWKSDSNLISAFNKLPINLNISNETVITICQ